MNAYRSLRKIRILIFALLTTGAVGAAAFYMAPSASAHQERGEQERDKLPVVSGYSVTIDNAGTGSDPDSTWETVSGGSLNIEVADASVGTDQTHTTTPGHKYVDTLTLRGPLTAGRRAAAQGVNEGAYEVLENGAGKFKVEIGGLPTSSANVESVTIEDLVIDEQEIITGDAGGFRVFGPGDAHFGSITIRSRVGKDSKELFQWWLDTSRGKNLRKSITVTALKRDGSAARGYAFQGCLPVSYGPFAADEIPGVAVEQVVVRCETVQLQTAGQRKDLVDWIKDTVQGKDWKRTLVVKEILKDGSDGKTYTYLDAFPTRYVFPAFSASGTGNLYEEVAIKPIRLELS